jgi:hypothetical protein
MPDNSLPDDETLDDLDGTEQTKKILGPSLGDMLDQYYEEIDREGGYTKVWEFISWQYRTSKDFVCESCGVSLVAHAHLIHVHHINANKGNNDLSNLIALCLLCHAAQHAHMGKDIKDNDRNLILELRRK